MITQASTAHRKNGRKAAPRNSRLPRPHPADTSLAAACQQQIAELESANTNLRQRLVELNASISDLIHSNAHHADLFQNAPVGYIIHDLGGAFVEINHTARQLLGFAERGVVFMGQFVRKDQLGVWLEHVRRANKSLRATTDLFLRRANGESFPVQMITFAVPAPFGRSPSRFRTVLIDTLQRHAAEAALVKTRQDYHRLIDTVEGIVWEADARTLDVLFVSRYAERLLGYENADWSRPGFWENRIYVDDRERVTNALARAVTNRQPLRIDYRVLTADRQVVWLHDNITPIEREGHLRLLGVAVDATEQHQTQEHLRRQHELLEQRVSERTAELGATVRELESFSYSVSHDLRAPLRAMLGYAEIAISLGGDQLPARAKECLEHIIEGGLRADRLVQDVLAYSRVSRANFELLPVELDKFVPNLIAQYPDFQPPKARVQVQSPLLPVLAHEALLAQCITNLLSNAVKFVAPGATPQVKIRTESVNDTEAVRLWIEDKGLGIEPQNLPRIFNIFERVNSTVQYPGTGIGLAIVRKAVERMGGGIGVESELGKGSKFWVQLKAV